jgi:hypothetical protein
MEKDLTLQIIVTSPPPNVIFGLQKGSGTNYETVQKQKSKSQENLSFKCPIKIKDDRLKGHSPKLSGPFVQGSPSARFIYIDIGTYAGQSDSIWSRRLKIPVTGINWNMIEQIISDDKLTLESHVPGTGKDGGPNCATVKPFEGWRIATLY